MISCKDFYLKTNGIRECNPCTTFMKVGLKLDKLVKTLPKHAKLPYHEAVGKLLWIELETRPDITYSVNYLSWFITTYSNQH